MTPTCPLCRSSAVSERDDEDTRVYVCSRCGMFWSTDLDIARLGDSVLTPPPPETETKTTT